MLNIIFLTSSVKGALSPDIEMSMRHILPDLPKRYDCVVFLLKSEYLTNTPTASSIAKGERVNFRKLIAC